MGSEFILLTSIPPRLDRRRHGRDVGTDYQRSCVESWINAGFSVVSFNAKEEAETLRRSGLPISVEIIDSGVRPRIRDLLAFASANGTRMCGLVNADCKFVRTPDLASKLSAHVDSTLLFSERIDIDPETDLPVLGNCGGFDAFFFDPASVADVTDSFFRLGDTWWDYWFPCELAARGIALQRLETPFVLHLWHERTWSADDHLRNGNYFRTCVTRLDAEGRAPKELTELLAKHDDVISLASATYARLRRDSVPVELLSADDAPMENLLRRLRESLATVGATQTWRVKSLNSQLRAVRDQLRISEAENQRLTKARSKLRLDIDGIIKSIDAYERERGAQTAPWPAAMIGRVTHAVFGGRARVGLFWIALLLVLLFAVTVLFLPQALAVWALAGLVCLLLALVVVARQVLRAARARARRAQNAYGQLAKRVQKLRKLSGDAEKR
ncbi:MAG: hypothetical protein KDJ72_04680 [Methyloceanibacter sp.]|uniref:hypothetical protein n=1 Tax=Methyloceanibacter sp. TaxID=1965321 RepID=UPI001DCE16AF|nr:hypothetical protein [Methyloceanibacter sp.]MCB1442297.1 hypothetical protein [Methyloceanibacter sp.]